MSLKLDVEAGSQHDGEAKYQQGLPGELCFTTPLLCRFVRLNQPSAYGPFPQLVGGEPRKGWDIP